MSETKKDTSKDMENLFKQFISSDQNDEEFEIRFGVKGRPLTKVDFDNVIKYLLSQDFVLGTETQTLKIQNEYIDPKSGKHRISNIRTEINGTLNIQNYCRTNSIANEDGNIPENVVFQQKKLKIDSEGNPIRYVDNNDFNFRVSYQSEIKMGTKFGIINQTVNDWRDRKKLFRLITRYSLTSSDKLGPRVDVSIVRGSKLNRDNRMIPTYNIQDSNVFNNSESYEVEIEFDKELNAYMPSADSGYLDLKKTIMYVLSGMQETSYPITINQQSDIKKQYFKLIHKKELETNLYPKHFIGPSSISLEMTNISPVLETSNIPNIRNPYCVTEKADGERKLMFISDTGKIYFINTNMKVQFTGCFTKKKSHFNSIVDGEHILFDKYGTYINTYAAFDIYFINEDDQRKKEFIDVIDTSSIKSNYRLYQLQAFVKSIDIQSVSKQNNLKMVPKVFEIVLLDKNADFKKLNGLEKMKKMNDNKGIFRACKSVLTKIIGGLYEYEIDGLIFTPLNTVVGGDYTSDTIYNFKKTWNLSFKWKPPAYNTVDFLVSTKKTDSNTEIINTIFETGVSMNSTEQIKQYKTLILMVGFDSKKHGYVNPCNDVINDKLPEYEDESPSKVFKSTYKPMPFYPSNPSKPNAYLCNIMLKMDSSGQHQMFTEDGQQSFEDNTIVEFKYEMDDKDGWQWKPIRVRYDKTLEYRSGLNNFGNAYHVAQSVWSSIHNPIGKEMLMTGEGIPSVEDSDVYYNRNGKSQTRALRDFHNLYIKKQLIYNLSSPGNTLYDLAVGKAGDFTKWISSKLKFVFGVDISKDNIENRIDGACARYLNYKKQYSRIPRALFINGDSSMHIKSGDACYSDKGRDIVNAVFGSGPKDEKHLGTGVYKQYGVAKDGFDVVSCQFAIHYFFENNKKLHTFLRNVSEGCSQGGYFIGTCYDGRRVFNELSGIKQGESVIENKNGQKIWEIKKQYDRDEFPNDETSLGYAIDVYQETINKMFREYLVNFDYLNKIMKNYGFEVLSKEESKEKRMPSGQGSFSLLHDQMINKVKKDRGRKKVKSDTENELGESIKLQDNPGEQRISFLNNYFIYKKISNVDAEKVFDIYMKDERVEIQDEKEETQKLQESIAKLSVNEDTIDEVADDVVKTTKIKTTLAKKPRTIKRLKKKLVIVE